MDKELTSGATGASTVVSGLTARLKDTGLTFGQMTENTKDNGRTINCMGRGSTLGLTEGNTMGITLTIKRVALALTTGQMGESMKATG